MMSQGWVFQEIAVQRERIKERMGPTGPICQSSLRCFDVSAAVDETLYVSPKGSSWIRSECTVSIPPTKLPKVLQKSSIGRKCTAHEEAMTFRPSRALKELSPVLFILERSYNNNSALLTDPSKDLCSLVLSEQSDGVFP